MTGIVRWEDPPPSGNRGMKVPRRSAHWAAVAEALRQSPTRWAIVMEGQSFNDTGGMATQIKHGRLAAFRPAGAFEAVTRTVGEHRVYARYIGGEET